jgi:hypothetical protein
MGDDVSEMLGPARFARKRVLGAALCSTAKCGCHSFTLRDRPGSTGGVTSRVHWWLGLAATLLLPIFIGALVLTRGGAVLIAVVVDGSVVTRFAAEFWRDRSRRVE